MVLMPRQETDTRIPRLLRVVARSAPNRAACHGLVPIGRHCRLFQLIVRLFQQILRFLSMALHVPLVRLLRGDDFLISLLAQPLRRRKIRVTGTRHIPRGTLRRRCRSNN